MNGDNVSFWKPVALSLMTALVVFMTTTWMMWPRDVATTDDIMVLRDEISGSRGEIQRLSSQVTGLAVRVEMLQREPK